MRSVKATQLAEAALDEMSRWRNAPSHPVTECETLRQRTAGLKLWKGIPRSFTETSLRQEVESYRKATLPSTEF